MTKEDAKEEYALHEMIRSVDGSKRFFVTADNPPCDFEQTPEEAIENPTGKCGNAVLQLPFGGESWETFVPADPLAFFRSWIQLFDAVEQLHRYEIAHMDIKAENIVTKDTYLTRLIDFGFAFSPESFQETPFYMELFSRKNYYPWPYEVKFLNSSFQLKDITETSLRNFYRDSVLRHSDTYPSDLYYRTDGSLVFNEVVAKDLFKPIPHMTRPKQLLALSRAIDVYSLGRALSRMYVRLTGHVPRRDTVVLKRKGYQEYTLFPRDPEFTIAKEQSVPFFDLIRKMMTLDPFQRLSISQAKHEFLTLAFFDGYVLPEKRPLPASPSPSPKTRRGGSKRKNRIRRIRTIRMKQHR